MTIQPARNWARGWAFGRSVLVTASGVVSLMTAVSPSDAVERFGVYGGLAMEFSAANAWWLAPLLLVVALPFDILRQLASNRKVWEVAHEHLDRFQSMLFDGDKAIDEHRVTLFRFRRAAPIWRCWPWDGWLVPTVRSGHLTQRSGSSWRAGDRNVEGFAGTVWRHKAPQMLTGLPDISNPRATQSEIEEYARLTQCELKRVEKKRYAARSYYGFVVERYGKLWGVIVIDSRDPELPKEALTRERVPFATFLGKLLEAV